MVRRWIVFLLLGCGIHRTAGFGATQTIDPVCAYTGELRHSGLWHAAFSGCVFLPTGRIIFSSLWDVDALTSKWLSALATDTLGRCDLNSGNTWGVDTNLSGSAHVQGIVQPGMEFAGLAPCCFLGTFQWDIFSDLFGSSLFRDQVLAASTIVQKSGLLHSRHSCSVMMILMMIRCWKRAASLTRASRFLGQNLLLIILFVSDLLGRMGNSLVRIWSCHYYMRGSPPMSKTDRWNHARLIEYLLLSQRGVREHNVFP